jgi:hypothetical protein
MNEDTESVHSKITVIDKVERTDIRQQQTEINDQLKRMEDLMSATISAVAESNNSNNNIFSNQKAPSPTPY